MNSDQIRNVQEYCENMGEVITKCRDYVHLIRGLHLGRIENPEKSEYYKIAIDVMYRSAWEALFAAFGTVTDRTPNTFSLLLTTKKIRKYAPQGHPARAVIKEIERDLRDQENSPLVRMRKWRNKFVAHHSNEGRSDGFYKKNKMHFDEVDEALNQTEEMINKITRSVFDAEYEFRLSSAQELERQVKNLISG